MSRRAKQHGCLFRVFAAIGVLLVLVIVVAGAGGAYAWWQWSSTPAYWQANRTFAANHTQAQLQHMADRAWNRWIGDLTNPIDHDPVDQLPGPAPASRGHEQTAARGTTSTSSSRTTHAHTPAPTTITSPARMLAGKPGTRTLHLRPEEINAWLRTRLPDWLANQGVHLPPQVSEPMISIEDGKPVVAFALHAKHIHNIISIVLDPKLTADGQLSLHVDSIRGGNLPMPADKLIAQARKLDPRHAGAIDRVLAILQGGVTIAPVIKLDSRQARLVGLAIQKDSIDLTIRHEKVGSGMDHTPPSLPGASP